MYIILVYLHMHMNTIIIPHTGNLPCTSSISSALFADTVIHYTTHWKPCIYTCSHMYMYKYKYVCGTRGKIEILMVSPLLQIWVHRALVEWSQQWPRGLGSGARSISQLLYHCDKQKHWKKKDASSFGNTGSMHTHWSEHWHTILMVKGQNTQHS